MVIKTAVIIDSAIDSQSAAYNLSGATSVDHVTIGGVTYFIGGGEGEDGLSVFRLEADGTFSQTGLPVSANIDSNDPRSITVHTTVTGQTYVYVGGFDNSLQVLELGADGGLTDLGQLQGADIASWDVESLESFTLDGKDYVLAASHASDGLTLYEIGSGGTLTVSDKALNSNLTNLDDVYDTELVTTAAGNTFVIAVGLDDHASVFQIDGSTGTMVLTDSVADDTLVALNDAQFVESYQTSTGTYVYVGGWNGIDVYKLGEDGKLTHVQHLDDEIMHTTDGRSVLVAMDNMDGSAVLPNGTLAVSAQNNGQLYFFNIDDETGQIYLADLMENASFGAINDMTAVGDNLVITSESGGVFTVGITTVEEGTTVVSAVDNQDNPDQFGLLNVDALETVTVNGEEFVISGGLGDGDISVFRVTNGDGTNPPTLTQVGIGDGAGLGEANIQNVGVGGIDEISAITTSTGQTFVYVAGQGEGINIYAMDSTGGLTFIGQQTDTQDLNTQDVQAMESFSQDGSSYLVSTSVAGDNLTLWTIDPNTGMLGQTFGFVNDDGTFELNDVKALDVIQVGGETYAIAGGNDSGLSVIRFDLTGNAFSSASVVSEVNDNTGGFTELFDVYWIEHYTAPDGKVYVYAGGYDNGVQVMQLQTNGTLTPVQNFQGGTTFVGTDGTSYPNLSFNESRDADINQTDGQLTFVSDASNTAIIATIDPATGLLTFTDAVTEIHDGENVNYIGGTTGAVVVGHTDTLTLIDAVPCFTRGTLIKTDAGEVAIENLKQGMRVLTMDSGYKEIAWIGSRKLNAADLAGKPNLRPIRIAQGALGFGLPERDLLVSPQHRMLVRSTIVDRMFGEREALLGAKHLIAINGIEESNPQDGIEYWHLLFDRHEVIFANGAPSESLYPGPEALKHVGAEALAEIYELFPELQSLTHTPIPARTFAPGKKARKLAERHANNNSTLYDMRPSDAAKYARVS